MSILRDNIYAYAGKGVRLAMYSVVGDRDAWLHGIRTKRYIWCHRWDRWCWHPSIDPVLKLTCLPDSNPVYWNRCSRLHFVGSFLGSDIWAAGDFRTVNLRGSQLKRWRHMEKRNQSPMQSILYRFSFFFFFFFFLFQQLYVRYDVLC